MGKATSADGERASVLTALGPEADPRRHLREPADIVDDAYQQVAAGLAANPSVSIKNGKSHMPRLEAAPLPEGFKEVHDAVAGMLPPPTGAADWRPRWTGCGS